MGGGAPAAAVFLYNPRSDGETSCFSGLALDSNNTVYESLFRVGSIRPREFDLSRFRIAYDRFANRRTGRSNWKGDLKELQDFRRSVRAFASITGLVFEAECPLAFFDMFRQSLYFDYSYLDSIPNHAHREGIVFMSGVGVPICIARRKIGVALFLSTKDNAYYPHDPCFWEIAGQIEACLAHAFAAGNLLKHGGFCTDVREYPKSNRNRAEYFQDLARCLDHRFRGPFGYSIEEMASPMEAA